MHVAMQVAIQKTQKGNIVHGILCHHFSIVKFLWIAFERKNRDRAYRLAPDLILKPLVFRLVVDNPIHCYAFGTAAKLRKFSCGSKTNSSLKNSL